MKHPYRILLIVLLLILIGVVIWVVMSRGSDNRIVPEQTGLPLRNGDTGEVQEVELANPASIYCVEQGGELAMVEGEQGVAGYCVLDDRRLCEEWAFYNSEGQECVPPEEDPEPEPEEDEEVVVEPITEDED